MKLKKILAMVLCLAMVLGTMSFTVFAEEVGGADFDANDGVVFDGTNYYTSLEKAVKGVHGKDDAVLYCKPNADLGTMSHAHVCNNITVYGNGATVKGDFEVDMPSASGSNCPGLTDDIALTVFDLDGIVVWGTKTSEYDIDINLTNCNDGAVFIWKNDKTITAAVNISMTDCVLSDNKVQNGCGVFSHAAGSIVLENVDFTGISQALALNNKSAGKQNIVMSDCDFTDCGASTADYTVPVSVKSSVEGGESTLVVKECTFSGTVTNNIGQDADILLDYGVGKTKATIVNTTAKVGVEIKEDVADYAEVNADDSVIMTNESAATLNPVAEINGTYYATLADAIDEAQNGDVVYLTPGTYTDELVINKSITITGNPNYGTASRTVIEKPVIKISDVTNGGVEYHAPNVTFDNLVFEVTEDATGSTWNIAAIGYYYENTANREGLAVTNCDFINNSDIALGAIAANIGKYTITNNTFKNFTTGVWSYVDHGAADEIVVSDNTFENVANLVNIYHGVAADGTANVTIVNNKATDDSTTQIAVTDFGQTKATPATAYDNITITGNDAEVVLGNYAEASFDATVENNDSVVYSYASETILRALESAGVPEGNVYVDYGTTSEVMYKVVDGKVYAAADALEVEFELASEAEGEKVYNINLKANAQGIINRLNSADLTFLFTQVEGNNEYEIIASNSEVAINPVDNSKVRYEFHYNGKDNVLTDTDTVITIGQVKFTGYGKFNFAVDSTVDTNAAHSTTMQDNIVDTFIPGGDNAAGEGDLDISDDTISGVVIAIPVRDLTINIDFPNAVADQVIAYQDMKVVISGGDLAEDITIDLGADAVETALNIFGQEEAKYVVDFVDGSYVINVTDALTVNNAYTVTVSGAGYRTAKYTVTMTTDKKLTFWNNVKDNAFNVEENKDASAKNVTFLAGDIVKDGQINIYDLSAVVSYFGEIDIDTATDEVKASYVKYDLNRDGKINSKDVAYVLVSWGK